MPPKRAASESTGRTEEAKLAFVTKFFYSQVQGKLDWKSAPIPEGRTMNACNHLMRGLKAKYITGGDIIGEGSGAGEATKAKKPKAKGAKAPKKRKMADVEEDEDDILGEKEAEACKEELV